MGRSVDALGKRSDVIKVLIHEWAGPELRMADLPEEGGDLH